MDDATQLIAYKNCPSLYTTFTLQKKNKLLGQCQLPFIVNGNHCVRQRQEDPSEATGESSVTAG